MSIDYFASTDHSTEYATSMGVSPHTYVWDIIPYEFDSLSQTTDLQDSGMVPSMVHRLQASFKDANFASIWPMVGVVVKFLPRPKKCMGGHFRLFMVF